MCVCDVLTRTAYGIEFVRVTGVRRYLQQIRAMFVKLILHAGRNVAMSLTQIVTPVFFVSCACLIIMILPVPTDQPPLYLNLSKYHLVVVPHLTVDGAPLQTVRQQLAKCYRDVIHSEVLVS